MGVLVIVGDDGDVAVAGVVERFAQKRRVVRQTAVADVFAGADGDGMRVPFSAVERGEGFADGHLSWEADVVMNVAFSPARWLVPDRCQARRPARPDGRTMPT